MSCTGTIPTRSNSPRAMIVNSASPLAEATAPITAVDASISPATGACTWAVPPSGRRSRASTCPAVTASPGSARISATFSPGRSGRTAVSSRAITMPDTSTISPKQDFAAFSTVTDAPFGASVSSAARQGEARERRRAARGMPGSIGEACKARLLIGIPFPVWRPSIPDGWWGSQCFTNCSCHRRSRNRSRTVKVRL